MKVIPSQTHKLGMQKLCPGHLISSAAQVILQLSSSLKSMQLYSPLHCIRPGIQRPFAHLNIQNTSRSSLFVANWSIKHKYTWIPTPNNCASCSWLRHFYRHNLNEKWIFTFYVWFSSKKKRELFFTIVIITSPSLWYTFSIVASEMIGIAAFSIDCCASWRLVFFGISAIEFSVTRPWQWNTASRVTPMQNE